MASSILSRRLFLIGSWATFLGVILYFLLGSLSRNIYILDAIVVVSLSMTLLGLLALIAGGVMWAWRASIAWTLMFALVVGGVGLFVAEYGDVNVHEPTAILMFVVFAAVAVGGLSGLIAIVRLAPHIWRKKA
jgi:hypothetical protein